MSVSKLHQILTVVLWIWICQTLQAQKPVPSGSGSGFFITADGYFLTNYHVIKGAERIQIQVEDTLSDAKLIKTDPANDIAILKADGLFVPLPIGLPTKLSIGDDVFTVGFPAPLIQGFAPKLTKGNINASTGLQDDPRFFQISIPVQPGNSGGPLIDETGNAVGIVTSTLSPAVALSEGFIPQNVNYAVKAAYASPLIATLPDIASKLPDPITTTLKTPSQVRVESLRAVGLVLVYLPSYKQREPRKAETKSPDVSAGGSADSSTLEISLQIKKLEKRLAAISSTHNVSQLNSLTPDDYVGMENGRVRNKTVFLNNVENNTDTCAYVIDDESLDVRIFSPARAVVTGVVRFNGNHQNGVPFRGSVRFRDTWVKRDVRWLRTVSEVIARSDR